VYEDTPITTFAGLKKIKDVKEGDRVLTHRGRFRKVTKTFKHAYTGKVVKIRFGGVAWVTVTEDHPVLVGLTNWKWVAAKDVKVGDKVSVAGSQGFVNTPVLSVDYSQVKDRTVYNLSVAEDESYIAKGMVVHNCRCTLIAELDESTNTEES
jgi:intein/homing endonuclease